ncbi:MAG: peptidase [Rhodospirillales bacterium]|nr:peptidase [Rhodospirillales bacterium]
MKRIAISATVAMFLHAAAPARADEVRLAGGDVGGSFAVRVVSWREMPFRTVVRQRFDFSCGSAAVATLLRHHYGRDTSEEAAFRSMYARGDQARIQQVGFSLLDMKLFLEREGFEADGWRITLDELAAAAVPVITLLDVEGYKHFVVVKGLRQGRVLLGDPARGLLQMPADDFARSWTGVVLAIRGGPGSDGARDRFNRDAEWRGRTSPFGSIMPASAATLMRDTPTLWQVTTTFSLDQVLR